jgi:hypothetical protein
MSMKKHTSTKALELKLQRLRALTAKDLGVVVGGLKAGNDACTGGSGCGCTQTGCPTD